MSKIDEILKKVMDSFKERNGEDATLEDGESIIAVFKDGVIQISNDEERININIELGEPYLFNESLDI